ncbi:MAG TPA: HEAT repeat domain-containing protein [Pirellulales bacterium]|nr:HEAT repeat domain-containing protein [Pirellulales bacterium]
MTWDAAMYEFVVRGFAATLPLLIVSAAVVAASRQPVRRVRLIELTFVACLSAPWLGWLPGMPHWSAAGIVRRPPAETPVSPNVATDHRNAARHSDREATGDGTNRSLVPNARAPADDLRAARQPLAGATRSPQPPVVAFDLRRWIVIAYLVGVSVMTAWWLFGMVGLLRLLRSAETAGERCRKEFDEVAGKAGSRVRLLVGSHIEQPFTFTWHRAVIVLPRELCDRDDPRPLRWALAHVRRHDSLSWSLAGLVRIVFFYQPLVWWLRGQLRLAQDYVADAQAAGQAPSPEDYAEFLTTWVAAHGGRPPAVGLGIGGRTSELYRRIVMLVERRRPLETHCPRRWRWAAVAGVLSIVTAAATHGEPPKSPAQKAPESPSAAASKTAKVAPKNQEPSPDASPPQPDADTRRLVEAVLARATAIKSGTLVFTERFDVPGGGASDPASPFATPAQTPEPIWQCSLSGESWAIRIPPKTQIVNHDGRYMDFEQDPDARGLRIDDGPRLTIEPATTWTKKQFDFPVSVGTIATAAARDFVRANADRVRATGAAKVDDVDTRIVEWEVGPTDLRPFDFVNDMLKSGGTLRLYVADQLGAALPRIEYVDRFGTVQRYFSASDFREVADGILFPFHYNDSGVKFIDFEMVERVNQKPHDEFVIGPVPSGTHVHDTRPKSGDDVNANGERIVDLSRYPYRQFTTGAEYPNGLPTALLKELDRDVIAPAAEANQAIKPGDASEWNPPKNQLLYGGKRFTDWEQQLLNDLEPKRQVEAITALQAFGMKGYEHEALTAIARALKSDDWEVKECAFGALSKIGVVSVPVLLDSLKSPDPAMRVPAAKAIGEVGPAAESAIDALKQATRDKSGNVRFAAVRALTLVGAAMDELRPLFEQFGKSDDANLRRAFVTALSERGDLPPGLLPLVVAALDDDDWQIRLTAGQVLMRKGSPTRKVTEGLKQLLHDEDNGNGGSFSMALAQNEEMNLEAMSPVLVEALSVPLLHAAGLTQMLDMLLGKLRRLGPKAADAVPTLTRLVDRQNSPLNDAGIMAAMDTLGAIGPAARDAVPALKAWTATPPTNPNRDWERIEKHAFKALEKIKHGDDK